MDSRIAYLHGDKACWLEDIRLRNKAENQATGLTVAGLEDFDSVLRLLFVAKHLYLALLSSAQDLVLFHCYRSYNSARNLLTSTFP